MPLVESGSARKLAEARPATVGNTKRLRCTRPGKKGTHERRHSTCSDRRRRFWRAWLQPKRSRHTPAQIILIDRTNHHLFQPLLYQVATSVLNGRYPSVSRRSAKNMLLPCEAKISALPWERNWPFAKMLARGDLMLCLHSCGDRRNAREDVKKSLASCASRHRDCDFSSFITFRHALHLNMSRRSLCPARSAPFFSSRHPRRTHAKRCLLARQ
jgi:hypothetical protein